MKQFLLWVGLLCTDYAFSQHEQVITDVNQIRSELLQENRQVFIFKSPQVSEGDSVQLIYLIDGEYAGNRVLQLMDQFGNSLSGCIFVGIVNTDRRRDLLYVNGASRFLEFLTQELVPVVEKNYIIKQRILYGHSFGGSFAIFAMLQKPGYFNGYIASSPTPMMDLVQNESYLKMDSVTTKRITFVFSCGSHDMKQVIKWSKKLSDNLSGLSFNKLNWQYRVFEGKDHYNSDVVSLMNGLRSMK